MPVFGILEGFGLGYSDAGGRGLNITEHRTFGPLAFPMYLYTRLPSRDYELIELLRYSNIGLKCVIGKCQGQKGEEGTECQICPLIECEYLPI